MGAPHKPIRIFLLFFFWRFFGTPQLLDNNRPSRAGIVCLSAVIFSPVFFLKQRVGR